MILVCVMGLALLLTTAAVAQDAGEPRVVVGWDFEEGMGPWVASDGLGATLELVVGDEAAAEGVAAVSVHYNQRPPQGRNVGGGSALLWCPGGGPMPEAPTCLEFAIRSAVTGPFGIVLVSGQGAPYVRWLWLEAGQWHRPVLYLSQLGLFAREVQEPRPTKPLDPLDMFGGGIIDGVQALLGSPPSVPIAVPEPRENELRLDAVRFTTRTPPGEFLVCDPGDAVPSFAALCNPTAPIERVEMGEGQAAWRVAYELPAGKIGGIHWFLGPNLTEGTVGIEMVLRSSVQGELVLFVNSVDQREFLAPVTVTPGEVSTVQVLWEEMRPSKDGEVLAADDPRAGDHLGGQEVQDLSLGDGASLLSGEASANVLEIGTIRLLRAGG